MNYSLGVDLGTTFVAAALGSATRVEMFTLGDRSVVTPAAVYLREDGVLVTGEAAGLRAVRSPDRVSREFKRRLGNPTPVTLGGQAYPVTALLGALLRDVLRKVTETEGQPPESVMLTHPANWGPFRLALFEEVAHLVGLQDPPMVTEPAAAAAHYAASRRLADGEIVAVYDLGGGTFDATVLRKHPGGVEILGTPEGIERLGGVDFDEAILSYVDYAAGGMLSELDMGDPQTIVALARLRQDCVLAKEALSVDTEATIPVFLPGRNFDVQITRSGFEDLVRAPIESTIGALSRTLQSAQVDPAELRAVLLVGGSSRIPLVAQMVSAELGCPTVVDTHPKYAVALGAAALATEAAPTPVMPTPVMPAQRPPSPDNGYAGPATRQSSPAVPETDPISVPPAISSAPRPPGRRFPRPGWALIAAGVTLVAGLVALVLAIGPGYRPTSASPGPPAPRSAPVATAPEAAIPVLSSTIHVGKTPGCVAVSPDGRQAYVANRTAQVITVVDTGSNRVTASIPIHAGPPQFLAFSPDGRTLYISVFNDQQTIHAITVLDTATNTVTATIPQPARPFLPAVSPDGKRLFVPNHDVAAVSVIDTATHAHIAQIKVAPNAHWVAFSPDGRRAYTANHESNLVSVIDTATLTVLATIPVGASPHSVAVHPTLPLVAATNYDGDSVSMIDTATRTVVATIPVGHNPRAITWAPDGRFGYVVNEGSRNVSVIDARTRRVTATIATGEGPTSIAVLPNGRRAYVSNVNSDTLTVLETTG